MITFRPSGLLLRSFSAGALGAAVMALIGFGCATRRAAPSSSTVAAMSLLRDNCLSCHNADKRKGGLVLSRYKSLLAGGDNGPVVEPGNPDGSELYRVLLPDADPHMPPRGQLSSRQLQVVQEWIAAGPAWDQVTLEQRDRRPEVRLAALPPGYQPALALTLSPDGARLALARGNHLEVHDLLATNAPVLAATNHFVDAIRALAWSPDGRWVAAGSYQQLEVLNAADMSVRWRATSNLLGRITALSFTPYGGVLLAADSPAAAPAWVRLFATESGREIDSWMAHQDAINGLAVSPDGGRVATAGSDKLIKLWELVSHLEIARYEGHVGAVTGVGFNADASELLSVGIDKQLKVWDVKSREGVVTIGGRRHSFTAGTWSGDGKTAVATDTDGHLYTFKEFSHHSGAQSSATAREKQLGDWAELLHAVTVNVDGTRIAVGGQDGVVRLLDDNGKVLRMFEQESVPPPAELAMEVVPSFVHDVLPALARAGCMAGACHAKPEGQNGFKLSVFSYNPPSDYAEIVKDDRGRRVFPAAPEESLLLLKPTLTVDHEGGRRIEPDSDTYRLLVRWIAGGMPYQLPDEPALVGIRVEPRDGTYPQGSRQALKVLADYDNGSARDVTALAEFASQDKELATVDETGLVHMGKTTGESVVVARFMGFVDAAHLTVPAPTTLPRERYQNLPIANFVDEKAYAHFEKLGLFPSARCTDEEFIRRSTLDTIGRLPTPDETRAFLADPTPDRRGRWIERLLGDPAWADYWANKWADLLRPNPDRVGVKSVYVLDQWLREAFRRNLTFDRFARAFVIAEGSNHLDGPAVVYRDRREPPELTTMFSQLFLGVRLECARCHHHPNEKWSQDDFYRFAAYFGPVKQKGAGLSPPISAGTELFYFAPGGQVKHPVTDAVLQPRPPDGEAPAPDTGSDPRLALADWLTRPDNPFFARSAVNRVWAAFFGRGMVEPVDDFRTTNPPVNEPLLAALAEAFRAGGYDLKALMRTILNSELYQLSSTPNETNLADTKHFSRAYRRRMPAEVALDAVSDVTGAPERFDGCPPGTRAVQTWTFKINSQFLDAFGRPNASSDPPCERDLRSSVVQSLHMMNSQGLQSKLSADEGRVRRLLSAGRTPAEIVTELYLAALSRFPSEDELHGSLAVFDRGDVPPQEAAEDVLWALLNSPEFVFNH